jgi:hypothetical protein
VKDENTEAGAGPARRDEPAVAGGPDEAAAGVDEERLRAALEELRRLRVEDLAAEMMVTLVTVGYQKMGVSEQTRGLRDLGQASLAIELLRALVETLARVLGEAVAAPARSTLDAIQLDYARTVMGGRADEQQAGDKERPGGEEQPDDKERLGGEERPDGEEHVTGAEQAGGKQESAGDKEPGGEEEPGGEDEPGDDKEPGGEEQAAGSDEA